MGRITKGILGGFSGTVGTVIGGNWKGIDYMRSMPNKKTGSSSQAQLEQQAKFGIMIKFISSMTGLLMETFKNYAVKMTGQNSALSYNLKNAIAGTYPAYSIDYTKILVSRGDLPNAISPTAAKSGTNVAFSWTDNSGTGKAKTTDNTVLVVYCADTNQAIYTVGTSNRGDGSESLDCSNFAGKTVQTFIGFMSVDGKEIATSMFTGQLSL